MRANHLDRTMQIADIDPTPTGAESGSLPDVFSQPPARIPELEAVRARLAGQLFGVDLAAPRIGRFRLLEKLGEGGMGQVFVAHDDALGRRVVVKLLHTARAGTDEGRARMLREAQALARLSHPNVVQVFEVGEHEGQIYAAMEFVEGQDLARWLARPGGRRPWREVLAAFLAAGEGLQAAHEAGLVHRDFKPANVIVGVDGRVRVLDFGLARASDASADEVGAELGASLVAPLTMTGALHGTPVYLAPECARGRRADARSDQYAFCVALHEGLYGARPFEQRELAALMSAKLRGQLAPPPAEARVPAWLHAALLRGLSVDPAARWPSMRALLAELGRDRAAARWRRWSLAAGSVLAVTAAIAGARSIAASQQAAAERARAQAAEEAAATRAREHALVTEAHALEAGIRQAQDLSASPVHAREATRQAAAALRTAHASGAPTTSALRALVTAIGAPRLVREVRAPSSQREVMFAAQEQVLVTWGIDRTLRLWEAASGRMLAELPEIRGVRVTPEGALVAVDAEGLALRDPRSGEVTRRFGPALGLIELSPDGRLAAVSRGDEVDVWDLRAGTRIARLPGGVQGASFSADGSRLVLTHSGSARLWSLPDGRALGRVSTTVDAPGQHTTAAISPDGRRVAIVSNDHDLFLWDTTSTSRLLVRAPGHRHVAFVLRFSADGRTLLSAGGAGQVFLWSAEDGRTLLRLEDEHALWYAAAALSPDGRKIAAGDAQGMVRVWDAGTGALLSSFSSERGEFSGLRFTADGRRLLTAAASGAVSEWALPQGVPVSRVASASPIGAHHIAGSDRVAMLDADGRVSLRTLAADEERVDLASDGQDRDFIRVSSAGDAVLTVAGDGLGELWDAASGVRRCALPSSLRDDGSPSVVFTASGDIAGVLDGSAVQVWSGDDCSPRATLSPATGDAWRPWLVASPAGEVMVLTHRRTHTLVDPEGRAAPRQLDLGQRETVSAAFSPDGAVTAVVGREGLGQLWDATTGEALGELPGLAGWVTSADFSPDGATLVTLGGGHAAHLWRVSDRALLARLEVGDMPARAAFSADGARLLIADVRGRVGLWDARSGEFAGVIARLEGRPQVVAFSADDADALLVGAAHGAVRVPASVDGVLAASAAILAP